MPAAKDTGAKTAPALSESKNGGDKEQQQALLKQQIAEVYAINEAEATKRKAAFRAIIDQPGLKDKFPREFLDTTRGLVGAHRDENYYTYRKDKNQRYKDVPTKPQTMIIIERLIQDAETLKGHSTFNYFMSSMYLLAVQCYESNSQFDKAKEAFIKSNDCCPFSNLNEFRLMVENYDILIAEQAGKKGAAKDR